MLTNALLHQATYNTYAVHWSALFYRVNGKSTLPGLVPASHTQLGTWDMCISVQVALHH